MGLLKVGIDMKMEVPDYSKKAVEPLIEEIATKISNDAKKNIRNQIGVDGSLFAPLAKKTLSNKRSKGSSSPSTALVDKGVLLRSIHVFKLGTAKYASGVKAVGNPRRDDVARWQQIEGVNQHTRTKRHFIGVSDATTKWIRERTLRFFEALQNKSVKKTKQVRVQ